jgi:hypothetical protein
MSTESLMLCGQNSCRLLLGHRGDHRQHPMAPWAFMEARDKDKLTKAGFATPRGGNKGAYQNHVLRSNRVIVPFERLGQVDLANYSDGYVVRLFPEQYFGSRGVPKTDVPPSLRIGENAFVLYRTHESYENFPPLATWRVRALEKDGVEVDRWGPGVVDVGHFVKRIPALSDERQASEEGPPQGIFAPEYADAETNYLCKCVLAWLIVHCHDSPYTTNQILHLRAILESSGVFQAEQWERKCVTRGWFFLLPALHAIPPIRRTS